MQQPLAYRLRPKTLADIFGQQHLIGSGKILNQCINKKQLFSLVFYGPAGTGKTTLALVLAAELKRPYRLFNAVINNKQDMVAIFEEAKLTTNLIMIIEEIHRLNKDKQDLLLPYLEAGVITVIGTTTANPFHAINPAIRSRLHLLEVKRLSPTEMIEALNHLLAKTDQIGRKVEFEAGVAEIISQLSNGDLRYALNLLEVCLLASNATVISKELVLDYLGLANMSIYKGDDEYFDALSALQKSIRGSDVNAALYYLARLIVAEDLDSLERRLLATAYEDIGLANPAAAARAVSAIEAAKRMGFPEAKLALAVTVIELALSPKSKSANQAIDQALALNQSQPLAVPTYLRLTTALPETDRYPYDRPDLWPLIQYLPDEIQSVEFYIPNLLSEFERILANNYQKLRQNPRSKALATLKKP